MYIERDEHVLIERVNRQFKVLLLTGPRQVGKSTLLSHVDSKRKSISLDSLSIRELAENDPELFIQRFEPPVLIDEVQYAPQLFSSIKSVVDQTEAKGSFWLTGSQQFHLMKNVSESLAGRVAVLRLLGLSQRELKGWLGQPPFIPSQSYIESCRNRAPQSLSDVYHQIWRGSFPALWQDEIDWEIFFDSYFQTYLQRDVRNLTAISNELDFVKFVRMCAIRCGQQLNLNAIANEVGITQPTAKAWLSVLEASGLVYLLTPYFNNQLKRLVKSPKLYFTDTGLCAFLSGWLTQQTLELGAMNGPLLENFVIIEILKSYRNVGKEPRLFYYRDSDGREIDLIVEQNGKLYPIQIKKTASPNASMVKNFNVLPENLRAEGALLCFAKEDIPLTKNVSALPMSYL